MDVFTGEPFRYRSDGKGYLLYSIGDDMKDDGGYAEWDIAVHFGNGKAPGRPKRRK
jgi:hypothetical protein